MFSGIAVTRTSMPFAAMPRRTASRRLAYSAGSKGSAGFVIGDLDDDGEGRNCSRHGEREGRGTGGLSLDEALPAGKPLTESGRAFYGNTRTCRRRRPTLDPARALVYLAGGSARGMRARG